MVFVVANQKKSKKKEEKNCFAVHPTIIHFVHCLLVPLQMMKDPMNEEKNGAKGPHHQ